MKPNVVDWIALGIVAFAALGGMRRGLVVTALSLGGLAGGAYAGSRVAPHLLHGGAGSGYTPLAGLIGAVLGAILLQTAAGIAGSLVRGGLRLSPLRLIDSFGGLVLGVVSGVVLVWVLSATLLLIPGQSNLRRDVQQSAVVRRLDQAVPPRRLLKLLARIDPFPSIAGPTPPSSPPPAHIAVSGAGDVVRVLGTACGVGIEGSGWFATRDLVVTAAHVVAGEHDTGIEIPGSSGVHSVTVVAFDAHNDVAVLRFGGEHDALPLVEPRLGRSGRDRRLSRRRAAAEHAEPDREDGAGADAGRVRERPRLAHDHRGGRRHQARRLGRARDRCERRGGVDDLRGAPGRARRLRRAGLRRAPRARLGGHRVGVDRRVRLGLKLRQKVDDVHRHAERRHDVHAVCD